MAPQLRRARIETPGMSFLDLAHETRIEALRELADAIAEWPSNPRRARRRIDQAAADLRTARDILADVERERAEDSADA